MSSHHLEAKHLSFLFIFLFSFYSVTAIGIDNPNIPIIKPAPLSIPENTTINITSNSSNYWETNLGSLGDVSSSQFTNSGGTLTILFDWIETAGDAIWCKLTGCTMTGDIDMNNNNINNVDSFYVDFINTTTINGTTGYFEDIYLSNSTLYIGDTISLSANGATGTTLNISGGNVSAAHYFGSGEFLTNLNLTGISFDGDSISADNFTGGSFYGIYDWKAEAPFLYFNGTHLTFNESQLNNTIQDSAEVKVLSSSLVLTSSGGIASATSAVLDFEIKRITVTPNNLTTKYRFEAIEYNSGAIIDKDRALHTGVWDIEKSYAINDAVNISITSANPDDTFNVTFKYLDNFN